MSAKPVATLFEKHPNTFLDYHGSLKIAILRCSVFLMREAKHVDTFFLMSFNC
jgi:hypothetical protein